MNGYRLFRREDLQQLLDQAAHRVFSQRPTQVENTRTYSMIELQSSHFVPHAEEIISSLWLRSLNVEQMQGAEPHDLQIDITRAKKIDDNAFEVELAQIIDNSFNIHQVGGRLLFRQEENALAKLLSYAKNNRIFREGEHAGKDIEHLAEVIQYVLGGDSQISAKYRVLMPHGGLSLLKVFVPFIEFSK